MLRIKRTTLSRLAILVVLYPWMVSYTPVDSLVTELGLSIGAGREVRISRDCDGRVVRRDELPFTNVAAGVTHQLSPEIGLGLAAGYAAVRDDGDWIDVPIAPTADTTIFQDVNAFYVKPRLTFDLRYLGVSVGVVIATPKLTIADGSVLPSFGLRVGSRHGFAWESNYMQNDLLVGPGWFYTGLAFAFPIGQDKSPKYARLHFGAGGGPALAGIQMHAEIPLGEITIDPGFFYEPEQKSHGLFARVRYRLNAPPAH